MTMKVQIISKESIKPSSPTLPDHRTFNFSFLDQIAPPLYIPIHLFYANEGGNNQETLEKRKSRLKASLSDTLNSFYPIAGRINNNTSIDCNDEGIDYIEAQVDGQLSDVITHPKVDDLLKLLLPTEEPHFDEGKSRNGSKVLLAIQINVFDCGGIVISVCLSHKICDSYATATFINSWAVKVCNITKEIHTVSELASDFPQRGLLGYIPSAFIHRGKGSVVSKRFVFNSSQISSLKAQGSNSTYVSNPTRVEAVSAFIWRRFMVLAEAKSSLVKKCSAIHAVNLRGRMAPETLEGVKNPLGNIFGSTFTASEEVETKKELHVLVGKLRDAIKKVDSESVRMMQHGDDYLRSFMEGLKEVNTGEMALVIFSSWCRFPLYETDFGWGKPIWVSTSGFPCKNLVILMDTRSGDGIEAWVNMLDEDMAEFEQDQELLSLVSVDHS